MKHKLVVTGSLTGACACGGFMYVGITSGARKEIKDLFDQHAECDRASKRKKKGP